ncbi:hypothetical protein EBB79_18360 [Parasedimentitalea marina]|uniref:Uncharacterized protein n=1 Tax=Parasedimentitalea marina TaxID=2483033 RepID=A0A3T0N6H6_9RHOB|nr:hypothetical protein EBB79_18360 [Parasedimentitalea marina]
MISLLGGGLGALSLISNLADKPETNGLSFFSISPGFIQFGLSCLVLSVGLYSLSMSQLKIVSSGELIDKSEEDWCSYIENELGKLQKWHVWASKSFAVSVVTFFAAFAYPLIEQFCAAAL